MEMIAEVTEVFRRRRRLRTSLLALFLSQYQALIETPLFGEILRIQ